MVLPNAATVAQKEPPRVPSEAVSSAAGLSTPDQPEAGSLYTNTAPCSVFEPTV